jgi:predicted 3-demethylubiquinone-9 3-methyltransferase (glyoxalase superfamily)
MITMSFQAYLDAVETKTGQTPEQLVALAHERGFGPATKAMEVCGWLKDDYGVGRGHAMAFVHVLKNGATISDKHVGTTGVHRDESTELRLDGIAARGRRQV